MIVCYQYLAFVFGKKFYMFSEIDWWSKYDNPTMETICAWKIKDKNNEYGH